MTSRSLLVLFVLVAVGAGVCYGDSRATARERGKVIQARVDTLTVEVRRTDTVYRQTVRTLTKALTVYDSVRVSDTVVVTQHDTAVVYVQRAAADSTINMCRLTVFSCQQRIAATDSLVRALRSQVQFERDQRPGFISTWGWRLGFLALGYAAGR